MREKVKDIGRLQHMLYAINTLMEHKKTINDDVGADF